MSDEEHGLAEAQPEYQPPTVEDLDMSDGPSMTAAAIATF